MHFKTILRPVSSRYASQRSNTASRRLGASAFPYARSTLPVIWVRTARAPGFSRAAGCPKSTATCASLIFHFAACGKRSALGDSTAPSRYADSGRSYFLPGCRSGAAASRATAKVDRFRVMIRSNRRRVTDDSIERMPKLMRLPSPEESSKSSTEERDQAIPIAQIIAEASAIHRGGRRRALLNVKALVTTIPPDSTPKQTALRDIPRKAILVAS
jgi:hypothetical protein